ncbi:hypothetical protein [Cedecea lapagei]|uniref:hypothetical protein n=1 Tax=Cedecea lapagei TaxID=158823 RepID=UPI001BCEF0E3|nr:hypothetical protein [Cedecea lapagei]
MPEGMIVVSRHTFSKSLGLSASTTSKKSRFAVKPGTAPPANAVWVSATLPALTIE